MGQVIQLFGYEYDYLLTAKYWDTEGEFPRLMSRDYTGHFSSKDRYSCGDTVCFIHKSNGKNTPAAMVITSISVPNNNLYLITGDLIQ